MKIHAYSFKLVNLHFHIVKEYHTISVLSMIWIWYTHFVAPESMFRPICYNSLYFMQFSIKKGNQYMLLFNMLKSTKFNWQVSLACSCTTVSRSMQCLWMSCTLNRLQTYFKIDQDPCNWGHWKLWPVTQRLPWQLSILN